MCTTSNTLVCILAVANGKYRSDTPKLDPVGVVEFAPLPPPSREILRLLERIREAASLGFVTDAAERLVGGVVAGSGMSVDAGDSLGEVLDEVKGVDSGEYQET